MKNFDLKKYLAENKLLEDTTPEFKAQVALTRHPNYKKLVDILADKGLEVMGTPYTDATGMREVDGLWHVVKWDPGSSPESASGKSARAQDINDAFQQAGIKDIIARPSRPYGFRLTLAR